MKIQFRAVEWTIVVVALLIALLCYGCTEDRKHMQVVADSRAAAELLSGSSVQDPALRDKIVKGLVLNVIAATSNIPDLPPPTAAPMAIAADPDSYLKSAEASAASPPPYVAEDIPRTGPSAPEIVRNIGRDLLYWSAWVGCIGIVILVVGAFGMGGAALANPVVFTVIKLAASMGSAGMVVGGAMTWLADYFWLVVLACTLSAIGVAIYHRHDIRNGVNKLRAKLPSKPSI